MLELWEIILPNHDNQGHDYGHAHSIVAVKLLECFGGYTSYAAKGGWLDDGVVYEEDVTVYRVLAEAEPAVLWFGELFPDQKALYIAKVGQGRIVDIQR